MPLCLTASWQFHFGFIGSSVILFPSFHTKSFDRKFVMFVAIANSHLRLSEVFARIQKKNGEEKQQLCFNQPKWKGTEILSRMTKLRVLSVAFISMFLYETSDNAYYVRTSFETFDGHAMLGYVSAHSRTICTKSSENHGNVYGLRWNKVPLWMFFHRFRCRSGEIKRNTYRLICAHTHRHYYNKNPISLLIKLSTIFFCRSANKHSESDKNRTKFHTQCGR